MGVLKRLVDLSKATAHEALNKVEKPVVMLNQYLRDMEEEIHSIRQALVRQAASERRLEQQIAESGRLAESFEKKAAEAVAAHCDAEARQAVEAKLNYLEKAAQYSEAYEESKRLSAELEYRLNQAKAEYAGMQAKRDELAARARKVESQARIAAPGFGYGLEGGAASRGFQRIEETILQKEAQAELASSMQAAAAASREALIQEQLARLRTEQSPS